MPSIPSTQPLVERLKTELRNEFPQHTQAELAPIFGLTRSVLNQVLKGKRRIPLTLAERYGLTSSSLTPSALSDAQIVTWLREQPGTKIDLAKRLEMPYATLIALLRGKCRVPGYLARRFGQNRPDEKRGRPRS